MCECVCGCVCAPGGHCSACLGGAESERASERESLQERAAKAGRGAQPSPGPGTTGAATMLNNLTDCEDGDGGANPGKRPVRGRRGAGAERGAASSGGGGRGGGEAGAHRGGGPRRGLDLAPLECARQTLSEVLKRAAPEGRAGGGARQVASARGVPRVPGADVP